MQLILGCLVQQSWFLFHTNFWLSITYEVLLNRRIRLPCKLVINSLFTLRICEWAVPECIYFRSVGNAINAIQIADSRRMWSYTCRIRCDSCLVRGGVDIPRPTVLSLGVVFSNEWRTTGFPPHIQRSLKESLLHPSLALYYPYLFTHCQQTSLFNWLKN